MSDRGWEGVPEGWSSSRKSSVPTASVLGFWWWDKEVSRGGSGLRERAVVRAEGVMDFMFQKFMVRLTLRWRWGCLCPF